MFQSVISKATTISLYQNLETVTSLHEMTRMVSIDLNSFSNKVVTKIEFQIAQKTWRIHYHHLVSLQSFLTVLDQDLKALKSRFQNLTLLGQEGQISPKLHEHQVSQVTKRTFQVSVLVNAVSNQQITHNSL